MNLYDKNYFFTECEGYKTFLSSKGLKLSKRLTRIYKRVYELSPKKVLDFGFGRGELSVNFALTGYDTYAVDSSDSAVAIAEDLKAHWLKNSPEMKLSIIKNSDSRLPFEDDFFDVAVFSDVLEHLSRRDAGFFLKEAFRTLKRGGVVFVHTSPNKIFSTWGLRLYKLLGILNGLSMPKNMREALPEGLKKPYHINEQTLSSVKKNLKLAGFSDIKAEAWKNPHYVYYFLKDDRYIKILNGIYRFLPLRELFFSDIFASGRKSV